MKLYPENYLRTGGDRGPLAISVEADDEGGEVYLVLETQKGETIDDLDVDRLLSPDEAEELAAMLRHHARAQRRRWSR